MKTHPLLNNESNHYEMIKVTIERPSDFDLILRNKIACMAMPSAEKKKLQQLVLKCFQIGFELGANKRVEVEI